MPLGFEFLYLNFLDLTELAYPTVRTNRQKFTAIFPLQRTVTILLYCYRTFPSTFSSLPTLRVIGPLFPPRRKPRCCSTRYYQEYLYRWKLHSFFTFLAIRINTCQNL